MYRSYVATVIAAVVTILLASRVLMFRAARSAAPGLAARLRFDLEWILRGAKNCIDDWIAASIARRARNAVAAMLHDLGDGKQRDLRRAHHSCPRQHCLAEMIDRSAVCARGENGR